MISEHNRRAIAAEYARVHLGGFTADAVYETLVFFERPLPGEEVPTVSHVLDLTKAALKLAGATSAPLKGARELLWHRMTTPKREPDPPGPVSVLGELAEVDLECRYLCGSTCRSKVHAAIRRRLTRQAKRLRARLG